MGQCFHVEPILSSIKKDYERFIHLTFVVSRFLYLTCMSRYIYLVIKIDVITHKANTNMAFVMWVKLCK